MKKRVTFNANEAVWVKLTEKGHRIYKENHEALRKKIPGFPSYTRPKEDERGFSRWQMWCLMQEFGEHLFLGGPEPFSMEMELEINIPKQEEI